MKKAKLTITFDLEEDHAYMIDRLRDWVKGDLDVYVGVDNVVVTSEIID